MLIELSACKSPHFSNTFPVRRNFSEPNYQIEIMTENKYKFTVQTSNSGTLNILLTEGKALFVLGANKFTTSTNIIRDTDRELKYIPTPNASFF